MKQSSMLSREKRKQLGLRKRNWSPLVMAIIFILLISIQACKEDCDKNFVKKYSPSIGDSYQSDTLLISLSNSDPNIGKLSCFAFKNLNGEIKLTFISSSDYSHFSFEHGDTTMIIIYGSVPKDTLIQYLASGDKQPGSKFNATTSFRMADALAADIVANKKNNQINFVLGTYKFVLSDEMYCMLKQMSNSKL
jgi:hypothetical protein